MTFLTTSGPPTTALAQADAGARADAHRCRRITPEAGHALEILGHAVEYLIDESMNEVPASFLRREQLDAIQILIALNHQVYFECPEVPSLGERCRALLRGRHA